MTVKGKGWDRPWDILVEVFIIACDLLGSQTFGMEVIELSRVFISMGR